MPDEDEMGESGLMEPTVPAEMSQADVDLFLQLSKKKDVVVLVPTNNIFIKEENNKAFSEISHISNIIILVRVMLILFLVFVMVELVVETSARSELVLRNLQYH